MKPTEGHLLRVFIGESDKYNGQPLYEWIINKAQQFGLAGATVIRGKEGFGAHHSIHTSKLLSLSDDLPIIIEIVDQVDKIEDFLPLLNGAIKEGLVTMEKVQIRLYRHRKLSGE